MTDECAYCNHEVTTFEVPAVDDDEGWALLAPEHDRDCEWIITRAHRVVA